MKVKRRRREWQHRYVDQQKHAAQEECNCPNCGAKGAHFVPPSFGQPGFYTCDPVSDPRN